MLTFQLYAYTEGFVAELVKKLYSNVKNSMMQTNYDYWTRKNKKK